MTELPPGFIRHVPGDPCPDGEGPWDALWEHRNRPPDITYIARSTWESCVEIWRERDGDCIIATRPRLTTDELWSRIMELEAKLNEKEQ